MLRKAVKAGFTQKAKLLAAPHILVIDNKEAKIQVGSQVPVITSTIYGTTLATTRQTIQYKDAGIILKKNGHTLERIEGCDRSSISRAATILF
jgi:hypothetical protein